MTDAQTGGRRFYAWLGRHVVLVDAVLAAGAVLVVGTPYLLYALRDRAGWIHLAIELGLVVPLAWRRTRPFLAACAVTVPCLVQLAFELPLGPGQAAVLVIIAANAAHAARWAARAVLVAALVGILLAAVRYTNTAVTAPVVSFWFLLVGGWALVGAAWLMGDVVRSRRLEREGIAERAAHLERERARDRELAAADERRHIARELHDIVAHSLAVVVTQADGARYAAAGTPGPAVPALDAIARTARTSLRDMRLLLGVLRDGPGATTAPAAGLADLELLVDAVRGTGLDVGLRTTGRPRPLTPVAEQLLFRVVQEALTNVLKHAGSTAGADVLFAWQDASLRVEVADTGPGPSGDGEGGHGLLGMRERLGLYGGSISFGPGPAGGALLVAELPYEGAMRD